jgi:hypothetical protein
MDDVTKMDETTPSQLMTPANVPNYRRELRPLPLRVATSQYQRLSAARNRTGISIQEHVRRAIDVYLAIIEKEAIELGMMPMPTPAPAEPTQAQPQKNPRVMKR